MKEKQKGGVWEDREGGKREKEERGGTSRYKSEQGAKIGWVVLVVKEMGRGDRRGP